MCLNIGKQRKNTNETIEWIRTKLLTDIFGKRRIIKTNSDFERIEWNIFIRY